MGDHGTGAAMMGDVATWIPSTCATCGGLRDGEDGPPWPFHTKGFFSCECEDDAAADADAAGASTPTPTAPAAPQPGAAPDER
jgi:hypothetical protein